MSSKINHHRIDYIELGAASTAASKDFYSGVFGWKWTDYGPDYTSFEDGRLTGGITEDDEGRKRGVLVVLYSDNLEETLRAVIASGGRITKEIFSFPGGRRFHFRDPAGNELAVWGQDPG
ncbi:MAG: VOC family protein [Phycisphaerales bacterium]|nr:VOC family protein [Phycisphaerales bacterium]